MSQPKQTTAWDRALEILDQMNALQRELEKEWPGGFAVSSANRFWRDQLVVSGNVLGSLRQAAISGVDMERVAQYGDEAKRV